MNNKAAVLGLLLLTVFSHTSQGEVNQTPGPIRIPGTPAGQRLEEFIRAINSGQYGSIESYISENFPRGLRKRMPASYFMQMYEESRGLDLCGIRETSETRVVGIFKQRLTGFWIDIGMIVGKRSPHEIQGLYLLPSGPPPGTPPLSELSDKEIVHELDEYLDRLAEAEVFSGTAILEKEGEILLSKACGRAHRGLDIPNRIGTRYNIASMGKMFTAVAIAQLVERGKLSYEDRINKFLGSDWISRKTGEKVRIQHLLTHTSGMGDYLPRLSKAPVSGFGTLEDFKSLCNRESPRFEPGTDWAYSNTGFLLLGAVIQEVSGKDYYEYIEENIFRPAGMTDTGFLTITEKMERPGQDFALSYFREYTDKDTTWRSGMSDSAFRIRGSPAGGAFSTAGDIQKGDGFVQVVHDDRVPLVVSR